MSFRARAWLVAEVRRLHSVSIPSRKASISGQSPCTVSALLRKQPAETGKVDPSFQFTLGYTGPREKVCGPLDPPCSNAFLTFLCFTCRHPFPRLSVNNITSPFPFTTTLVTIIHLSSSRCPDRVGFNMTFFEELHICFAGSNGRSLEPCTQA